MTQIQSELQREQQLQTGKKSLCKNQARGGYFDFAPKVNVDGLVWKACWIIAAAIILTMLIYFS